MENQNITVYIGQWNGREYARALTFDKAKSAVQNHFAFGKPSECEYALGDTWATRTNITGWKIVELNVEVPIIAIQVKTSSRHDTAHATWQCPICKQFYSEEWRPDEDARLLLMCEFKHSKTYFLGTTE